ncbi:hypothetical protein C8J57DRAFT_1479313 [Mycena rebaudengoi]|nr:hypothetical protein C8J57DRAFT_1479313 [Mycena rebaudengoi]
MSDSVAVLRARLADISTNITRQRKVLEDLECSRADTQRQLNSMLDPIGALPVEISSEIFILCLPDSGDRHPNPATAPLLLLRICKAWADIARSTPTLWDIIHVDFPRPEGFENLFGSYLARARGRGLSLTLTGDCDEDSFALLWAESALLTASANLKALTLSPPGDLYLIGVLSMLRDTPGLVECTLINGYDDDPRADSLTLPCLQSLSVGKDPYLSDLHILKYLSLPALRHLTTLDITTEADEALLVSFLTRLETPLQSLHVGISETVWQPVAYTRLLNLVPTLTCLWLSWDNASECTLFLDLLRRTPQGFLPQLRDLTVLVRDFDQPDFRPLYDLLSVRRPPIKSFRFLIDEDYQRHSSYIHPHPDVLPTLRQLAAECGTNIHFGTRSQNYI